MGLLERGGSVNLKSAKPLLCTYCKKKSINFKFCGCCKNSDVAYCSKECQVKHWTDHKSVCKKTMTKKTSIVCNGCSKAEVGEKLFECCSSCKSVRYCSKACQKSKWKEHKVLCNAITSLSKSDQSGNTYISHLTHPV